MATTLMATFLKDQRNQSECNKKGYGNNFIGNEGLLMATFSEEPNIKN